MKYIRVEIKDGAGSGIDTVACLSDDSDSKSVFALINEQRRVIEKLEETIKYAKADLRLLQFHLNDRVATETQTAERIRAELAEFAGSDSEV